MTQPPPQQPLGTVDLTLQGSMMTSSMITPAVRINGYPVPAQYGANAIPVHPGPTRIDVSCQWLKEYGQATLTTDVPPGGRVPVFYAAPLHQFSRGAIGHEKQKRPGAAVSVAILGAVLVLVVLVVLLATL